MLCIRIHVRVLHTNLWLLNKECSQLSNEPMQQDMELNRSWTNEQVTTLPGPPIAVVIFLYEYFYELERFTKPQV